MGRGPPALRSSLLAGAALLLACGAAGCRSGEAAGESAAREPEGRWASAMAGPGNEQVAAVVVAADGAVLVAGQFEEELEIGSDLLVAAGQSDAFIACFEPDGEPRWAERIGGDGFDAASALALLPDGGVVVAGVFSGELEGAAARGESDLFAASLSGGGARRWLVTAGGPGWDVVESASAATDGSVWIAGSRGRVERDDRARAAAGAGDALLVRLDPRGAVQVERRFGGAGWDQGLAIAATEDGGAVLVGSFSGALELDRERLLSSGSTDAFAAGLDASGAARWAVRLGGTGEDAAAALSIDGAGRIAVAVRLEERSGSASPAGAPRAVIAVLLLGPGGEIRRTVRPGAAVGDRPRSIAFLPGAMGNGLLVAATGAAGDRGDRAAFAGPTDSIVSTLDAGGRLVRSFRLTGSHVSARAAPGAGGDLVLAGSFVRSARVGGLDLPGQGGLDGFVASISL